MFQETGSIAQPPWRGGAFVAPAVPSSAALSQQQHGGGASWLKCRRRRPRSNGIAECLHAVPSPRSCSSPASISLSQASIQPGRPHARRPAARAGGNARKRGSHSSAAPQTLADPAVHDRCGGGIAAGGGIEVDMFGSSGGMFGDVTGDVVSMDESNMSAAAAAALGDDDHVEMMGTRPEEPQQQQQQQQQAHLNGTEEEEVGGVEAEIGSGMDAYSRQLIGGLTKLARNGLWKASFKVLRVEQALNARKVSAAQANGEEYSSSWPVVEQKAYNTILAALSRAGKWEEAVLLLKEMETRGIQRDAVSYACLIAACGRGMQWERALISLAEMRDVGIKANSFVYSAAIDACAKGRQWQKALILLRDMEVVDGLPANLICYNAAADACGKAGRPGEALALLAKMQKVGIKPNEVSYLSVISACSRVGDWKRALLLLDEMIVMGVQPDLKCYCSAITACGKGGRWKQALGLLNMMHKDGPPPNDYCYNAAISACGKSGQWREAKDLLSTMRDRGVPPDLISYNSAIDACGKGGRWEEGLKIFVGMVKAAEESWDADTGHPKPPTPDATTYGAAITACSRGKQWQMALRFLEDMEKKGVERTEGVFQATLAGCARMGRWRECIVTLDQMRKSGLQPRAAAYNSVITACGRGGEWQRAIAILKQMSSRGATPDVITLNAVMTSCAQSQRWKQARVILDFMRDPNNVATIECGGLLFPVLDINGASTDRNIVVDGLGRKNGEVTVGNGGRAPAEARSEDRAVGVPSTSTTSSSSISNQDNGGTPVKRRRTREGGSWPPRPDAVSFHTVTKALATEGMWHEAVELLEEMVEERRRFLRSDEAFLETTVGGGRGEGRQQQQQWPVNIDRFRGVFEMELKNNEVVGHEQRGGWSEFEVSPQVSLRAKAMDLLMVMEREEKEARLKRQTLYDNIARR
ncbi:unnamed protein product [Ectocarpus sp. 4 AP-2014]